MEGVSTELWLSPLSVWELLMLCRKGRLAVQGDPHEWLVQAMAVAGIKDAGLTFEIAQETDRFRLPHKDPIDRFLVATARVLEMTLITADRKLIDAKKCEILACN
jgi:PIN domain nuclease of toxin-antitoxin system